MIGLVLAPKRARRNVGDLPAEVRPGQHQVSVVLDTADAGKLVEVSKARKDDTWSDTIRALVRAAHARLGKRSGE